MADAKTKKIITGNDTKFKMYSSESLTSHFDLRKLLRYVNFWWSNGDLCVQPINLNISRPNDVTLRHSDKQTVPTC